MELTFFLLFILISLTFLVLGFSKKIDVCVFIGCFFLIISGTLILSGIQYQTGALINETSVTNQYTTLALDKVTIGTSLVLMLSGSVLGIYYLLAEHKRKQEEEENTYYEEE